MEELLKQLLDLSIPVNHPYIIGGGNTAAHLPTAANGKAVTFYAIMAVGGDAVMDAAGTLAHGSNQHPANFTAKEGVLMYGNWSSLERASGSGELWCYWR